jgi:hypothetical protein
LPAIQEKLLLIEALNPSTSSYRENLVDVSRSEVGERRYLVDARWVGRWMDYVNLEGEGEEGEGYDRPGTVNNKKLVKDGWTKGVKSNLVEFIDFVYALERIYLYRSVPAKAWRYFFNWYGADIAISKMVKKEKATGVKYLELYPGQEMGTSFDSS